MIPKALYPIAESVQFLSEAGAVHKGKGVHAYIIEGTKGIGKNSFALALACVMQCKEQEAPCFACSSCIRVLKRQHPDVHYYCEEKSFKVEQIRELLAAAAVTAYEGGKKIYILDRFHLATEQAQNALLKTLEEPPASVVFILLTDNIEQLLPTIRSRCRTIHLYGFDSQKIADQLSVLFPGNTKIQQAALECGGNIGKAMDLANNEDYWKFHALAEEMLKDTSAPRSAFRLEKNKDNLTDLLEILEGLIRKQLEQCDSVQKRIFCMERLKAIEDAQLARKRNGNNGLIIDKLAYGLAKGGVKWQR